MSQSRYFLPDSTETNAGASQQRPQTSASAAASSERQPTMASGGAAGAASQRDPTQALTTAGYFHYEQEERGSSNRRSERESLLGAAALDPAVEPEIRNLELLTPWTGLRSNAGTCSTKIVPILFGVLTVLFFVAFEVCFKLFEDKVKESVLEAISSRRKPEREEVASAVRTLVISFAFDGLAMVCMAVVIFVRHPMCFYAAGGNGSGVAVGNMVSVIIGFSACLLRIVYLILILMATSSQISAALGNEELPDNMNTPDKTIAALKWTAFGLTSGYCLLHSIFLAVDVSKIVAAGQRFVAGAQQTWMYILLGMCFFFFSGSMSMTIRYLASTDSSGQAYTARWAEHVAMGMQRAFIVVVAVTAGVKLTPAAGDV